MSQLGQAVFSLQDVLMAPDMILTINLQTHEMRDGGKVTVMAWINDDNTSIINVQKDTSSSASQSKYLRSRPRSLNTNKNELKLYFDNIISKTFRFATNNESTVLQVQENMGESRWAMDIPAKLLKLWIDEEKHRISLLQDLGELSSEWRNVQQEMTDFCMSTVTTYSQNISYIMSYGGPSFKPSCEKDNKEFEFIPVNLHIQRMTVASEGSHHGKVHDIITHGAFTAFCQKFKNGGLRKLLQYQKDFHSAQYTLGFRTKMQQACSLLNEIAKLKSEIKSGCEKLCHAALQGSDTEIKSEMESLTEIEVTRLNLEAAIVCLISKVDDFVQTSPNSDVSSWLGEVSPAVIKLQSFVEIVSNRATLFLTFLSLMKNKDHVKLMHMIKYRRDVVTAQAITSLITGIAINIQTHAHDSRYLNQLSQVGILVEFEGLLSCYSDEMAMIEDMCVAVDDLSSISVCFVEALEGEFEPRLSLGKSIKEGMFSDINRHCLNVEIPVNSDTYSLIPTQLRTGYGVKVIPVMFNIGITEGATLADKFGSTQLQERLNAESVAKIFTYFEKYVDIFGKTGEPQTSLSQLTKSLHTNVMTKKSKNVEVLHLAAEICHKLQGVRFSCCKSGKDRTAMGVTLEQVQVLQREHNLASHVFWQALDCFRSVGCRRDNTLKNTGVRKYAFNSLQMLYIPKLYRAPNGTYGNIQT